MRENHAILAAADANASESSPRASLGGMTAAGGAKQQAGHQDRAPTWAASSGPAPSAPALGGARRTLVQAVVALSLCTLSPTGGTRDHYSAPSRSSGQHPFVESMQIMMDAMGMDRQGGAPGRSYSWPQSSRSQDFSGSRGSTGAAGMLSPWLGSRMPGDSQMEQMMRQAPGPWSQGWPSRPPGDWRDINRWGQSFQQWMSPGAQIEGAWQGRSGEILVIQGDRYRIYVAPEEYVEGLIRIQDTFLWLGNPQSKTVQQYEFAAHDGRLALRDSSGQLLLFRRTE